MNLFMLDIEFIKFSRTHGYLFVGDTYLSVYLTSVGYETNAGSIVFS